MPNDASGTPAADDDGNRYASDRAAITQRLAELRVKDDRIGYVRILIFLIILGCGALAFFAESSGAFAALFGVSIVVFLAVVIYNEPIRDEMESLVERQRVLDQLISRLKRDWPGLRKFSELPEVNSDGQENSQHPQDAIRLTEDQHAVANDLDLFGDASLYRLVSMVATVPGSECLIRWLAGPADAVVSTQRYEAASLLAPQAKQRIDFYVRAKTIGNATGNPSAFAQWAGGPTWLESRGWLVVWANLSAALAIGLGLGLVGAVLGWLDAGYVRIFSLAMLGLAIGNVSLGALVLAPVHKIFSIAMTSRRSVQHYQELFRFADLLTPGKNDNPLIQRLVGRLVEDQDSATHGMNALSSVARAGGLKQGAATFLIYLPLQLFGLWDVRVMRKLETWQRQFGEHCRDWFAALGELEALMSVAAVHEEQSQWVRPEWSTDATLQAEQLGHPLLADRVRVTNSVSLGPPGTFLLVTGSNMSGKSTLLRSLGLNVALAAAGSKVCAQRFTLPSVELATSIRVSDSLADGVSFYMAELQRLKSVVDHARRLAKDPNRVVLFLLDEILQGTNSRERQIAVAQVIHHLVDSGAIGAISTHDLELADDAKLSGSAQVVHFRETITPQADGSEKMTFDYRMREGVSPTTNALRLLEMVGLGDPS